MDVNPATLSARCCDALLDDVVPFWQRHSPDREEGGYFTCLLRDGTVFDTDKFIWLQARQVWLFSMLFNRLEQDDNWLGIARLGADFLARCGRDENGDWYFALTRDGRPLVAPCNVFSDCFAAMAFSQFARAAGDDHARAIAADTFARILARRDDPKGRYEKRVPGVRPMRSLALPMILANLVLEMEWMLEPDRVEAVVDDCIVALTEIFRDNATGLLLENVAPDGSLIDSFEGRLISPGHGIEAMWFLMEIAERRGDRGLIDRAVETMLAILEFGWDAEHGGIFYFLDRLGHPPQQLEWDQKLWWVHLESMVGLSMAWRQTGRADCRDWFARVHDWAWPRFSDPDHGEWFGYLDRRGEVLMPIKGGKWKGCFHVPRALFRCMNELRLIEESADGS